jgi:alanine racemase
MTCDIDHLTSPVWIELDSRALKSNLRFLRREIGSHARISLVVKGNAYGHGIEGFVPMAVDCGVDHFSVFNSDEARRVHRLTGDSCDIMIMGYIGCSELDWVLASSISFFVFNLERLEAAIQAARRTAVPARVHLQLETGMNRLGLDRDELVKAAEIIRSNPDEIVVEGVCTHYAGAESISNYLRIQNQMACFLERCEMLRELGVDYGRCHSACSAAALAYPDTIMDMVRLGIVAYGFWPSRETRIQYLMRENGIHRKSRDPLRRILTLKTRVMDVKTVGFGEYVGYGTSCQTSCEQRVASIPVGYSTGLARSLSNLGHVLVHGRRAQIAGLVNMSMSLVDVTHINDVGIGDEVVIIGKQGRSSITVASFSDLTGRLNYEVLVRLPERIPRITVS